MGLQGISRLQRLRQLQLNYLQSLTQLPSSLSHLTQLERLHMREAALWDGVLPGGLLELPRLREVQLPQACAAGGGALAELQQWVGSAGGKAQLERAGVALSFHEEL